MKTFVNFLVAWVSILHFWFLLLEMFFWSKPLGLRTFRNTREQAKATAILAANQGLYNGFLAMGLLVSFFFSNPEVTFAFQTYFLVCVTVAGIYGAWSVSRKIFFIQALPAFISLVFLISLR